MNEPVVSIGCQKCGAEMSVARTKNSEPPEPEKCFYCEKLFCLDCIDWEYMVDKKTNYSVCIECGLERKNN